MNNLVTEAVSLPARRPGLERRDDQNRTSFSIFDDGAVTALQPLCQPPKPVVAVILYGGTKIKGYRSTVKTMMGEGLAHQGITVVMPDYRSNFRNADFHAFGLHDRYLDAVRVLHWVRERYPRHEICLIGVSMGGAVAAPLAACREGIDHLVLVAPAAYHPCAMAPDVKFGPAFSEAIRQPTEGWRECIMFGECGRLVSSRTLIIHYENDEVVPHEIPLLYRDAFTRADSMDVRLLPGTHRGSFTDRERVKSLVRIIAQFLRAPEEIWE